MTRRGLLWLPVAGLAAGREWVAADGSEFPAESWRETAEGLMAVGGLKAFQDVKTVKLYEEFDFRFEWKMGPEGNSGVKYQLEKWDRWPAKGAEGYHIRARGPEMQLVDDAGNEDARKGGVKQCGALYNRIAPVKAAVMRVGEYNEGRLVIRGRRVEHWVNGEKLVDYEMERVKPSAISLQNHACDVWFRDLRIEA